MRRSLIIAWQQALPLQNLLHIIDQNEIGLLQGKTGLDKFIKFTPVEVSLTNTARRVLVKMAENRLAIDPLGTSSMRPENVNLARSEAGGDTACRKGFEVFYVSGI